MILSAKVKGMFHSTTKCAFTWSTWLKSFFNSTQLSWIFNLHLNTASCIFLMNSFISALMDVQNNCFSALFVGRAYGKLSDIFFVSVKTHRNDTSNKFLLNVNGCELLRWCCWLLDYYFFFVFCSAFVEHQIFPQLSEVCAVFSTCTFICNWKVQIYVEQCGIVKNYYYQWQAISAYASSTSADMYLYIFF